MKEDWLRKGLGRPAIFLQKHPAKPYRELLLSACVHNWMYDTQWEEERAPYLWRLIELAGDLPFYREGILAGLSGNDEEVDLEQMFGIAVRFANRGDDAMRKALYSVFERQRYIGTGLGCAQALVELDGINGLQFATRTFDEVPRDDRPWQFRYLWEYLEKHHGKQAMPAELTRFEREWQADEQLRDREGHKERTARPDYETFKKSLSRATAVPWAQKATAEELIVAARDLIAEQDPERLFAYLSLFRWKPFPGPVDRLVELSRVMNRDLARAALTALTHLTDTQVRDRGLELLRGGPWVGFAPRLLARNAREGDYGLIEAALASDMTLDECHSFGLTHFVTENRSPEAEGSLLLLYEKTPCSICRCGVVKEMIAIGRFPDWMREECHFDCYSHTRELSDA